MGNAPVDEHQSYCTGLLACAGRCTHNGSTMSAKRLLVVAHAPSPNTVRLREAIKEGAQSVQSDIVELILKSPFDTSAEDVIKAQALILGTTENLGYMSGALKDFFDRTYNPCLEHTRGLPYALCIRAGLDGTGTRRAVESIASGLGWRAVQEALVCKGQWHEDFVGQCRELGAAMTAGLDAGIF